ncbi:MAG: type III-B CRISPR module-associated protein Cmr5 [Alphaproteobacteria bacterium]|nr:type III-B CRISPR module-associated protein Cmr5 [Alphaproteobacteria bacterium]
MTLRTEGRAVESAQERAKWAWSSVEEVREKHFADRYGTLARKLPSYLQVSGMGQTLAFLYAKGGDKGTNSAEGRMLHHLSARIAKVLKDKVDAEGVLESVVKMSPEQYRAATWELMASAVWLKRFAEGSLGEEEDTGGHS